jgi:hypothetical protein
MVGVVVGLAVGDRPAVRRGVRGATSVAGGARWATCQEEDNNRGLHATRTMIGGG